MLYVKKAYIFELSWIYVIHFISYFPNKSIFKPSNCNIVDFKKYTSPPLMTDIKSNSILSWANRQPFLQFYEALYRGPRCVRGCGNVSQIVGRCVSVQCPHVSVSGARSVASGPATLAHIKWRWSLQLISLLHSPHITMVAAQVSKHLINSRYVDM